MAASKNSAPIYTIRVTFLAKSWVMNHTYADFGAIVAKLSEAHPSMPALPPKGSGLFSPSEDPELKKHQFNQLLLKLLENHQTLNNKDFLGFLGIDHNVPEYQPIEIVNSSLLSHSTNSLHSLKFTFAHEDMFLLSNREGSTLGAIKSFMSFSSNTTGELEVYKKLPGTKAAPGPASMTLAAKHELKTKATCLYWLEQEKTLVVGLDSGSLIVYTVELRITPIDFKEKLHVKVHRRPITGIAIDSAKRLIYSVSEGRKLRTASLDTGEVLNGTRVSPETLISPIEPSSLTSLFLSPRATHCFMGTTAGRAYFYSLMTNPPLYAAAINAPARCCEVDWNIGVVVTAGDTEEGGGELSLYQFSLGPQAEVHKSLGGIDIGKGSCCLLFCQARSEVFIGYENGIVGVVALKIMTSSLICKLV